MPLEIVQYNSPILRKKGAPVTAFDAALKKLAAEMTKAMHAAEGIGLAAQQVGHAIQLCVIDLRLAEAKFHWTHDGVRLPLDLFMPLALVNPEVTVVPEPETVYEEGCLSFPQIRGDIRRPDGIAVKFKDVTGHVHVLQCDGLLSRCVQHEVDHLNGILFIDRMAKDVLARLEPDLKALRKRTREDARNKA